uniref:Uncharacterized protein n=1 Tax=Ixodes ricinus TaxID=34613 RepID=V5HEC5_IXORI
MLQTSSRCFLALPKACRFEQHGSKSTHRPRSPRSSWRIPSSVGAVGHSGMSKTSTVAVGSASVLPKMSFSVHISISFAEGVTESSEDSRSSQVSSGGPEWPSSNSERLAPRNEMHCSSRYLFGRSSSDQPSTSAKTAQKCSQGSLDCTKSVQEQLGIPKSRVYQSVEPSDRT